VAADRDRPGIKLEQRIFIIMRPGAQMRTLGDDCTCADGDCSHGVEFSPLTDTDVVA